MEIQLSTNTKTIGVIGLGSIGMRHAKNLLAMGHTVYGQDTNPERIDELIEVGGRDAGQQLISPNSVDGIVVASPTKFHLFHWANTTGPIFVEKPLADIYDCDVVREELSAQADEPIMVGNNLRFHSCVKWAKRTLPLIGEPFWASFTVSQKNTKYTDPVLLNWGAHEVDLALHLLGPATVEAAYGGDASIDVILSHNETLQSTIHCDYLAPVERRNFIIMGDKGYIGVDLANRFAECCLVSGAHIVFPTSMPDSWDQDYIDEMQAFIDLIDGKPVPHAATGQDGLAALEIIMEAQNMAGIK